MTSTIYGKLYKPFQGLKLAHACMMQALFRKIAAALPGMESLSAAKQEDLVDVNLSAAANTGKGAAAASGCAC